MLILVLSCFFFVVKESICESFKKIEPSVFVKMVFLVQIGVWGHFALNTRMLIELAILMPESFRWSLAVPTQEILAY